MSPDPSPSVSTLDERLRELSRRAREEPRRSGEVLPEALEELRRAVEALRAAGEDLRQQNEQMAAASDFVASERQRYQELFDLAPDGYLVTDLTGGVWEANRAAASLLGARPRDLVGQPLRGFVAEDDRREFDRLLDRLGGGGEVRGEELRLQPRGRGPVPASLYAAPARNPGGEVTGVRWLVHDVSDLHEARRRALQAERLAAVGAMVAGLAHEGRNALQRIQAAVDLLTLRLRGNPACLDLLASIQAAQDRLRLLHEDVRQFAGPLLLDARDCDVAMVWREAWAELGPQRHGRDAELREDSGGTPTACRADPERLRQVFRNIFENSLAACRDPVRLEVRCSPAERAGRPALRVAVRDNGPGLGPEQRRRIFEPFYTTKTRGTGLGMAIARRILDAHGGCLEVGDGPPGATIALTLPRREAP